MTRTTWLIRSLEVDRKSVSFRSAVLLKTDPQQGRSSWTISALTVERYVGREHDVPVAFTLANGRQFAAIADGATTRPSIDLPDGYAALTIFGSSALEEAGRER
jgi:hypothetical protein